MRRETERLSGIIASCLVAPELERSAITKSVEVEGADEDKKIPSTPKRTRSRPGKGIER
jgi:hypothetical protein